MMQEFKDFIAKGNLITIAVGLIMAVAFTALITALVDNILMPIVAAIFGQPSFDDIVWTVNGSGIMIGAFITALIAFLLVAVAVFFFIVKPYNAYQKRVAAQEEEAPTGPSEVDLLTEIRDALAARN